MRYAPEDEEEPPKVRQLRLMAMVLMVVLILGFLAMVGTIVIRLGFGVGVDLGSAGGAVLVTAEALTLPPGEIVATGQSQSGVLFVIERDGIERLVKVDAETGEILSDTPIVRELR
ncbi:MAG: DUF6476 family protein [Pseudomonadota bacterium]